MQRGCRTRRTCRGDVAAGKGSSQPERERAGNIRLTFHLRVVCSRSCQVPRNMKHMMKTYSSQHPDGFKRCCCCVAVVTPSDCGGLHSWGIEVKFPFSTIEKGLAKATTPTPTAAAAYHVSDPVSACIASPLLLPRASLALPLLLLIAMSTGGNDG